MTITRNDALALIRDGTAEADTIIAEACRRSLGFFTELFWPVLEPGRKLTTGWLLDAIDEHLTAITTGDIRKLLITVPPGSMKSLKTRVFWPTWEWIQAPTNRYLGFSYAEALATRDNRRARMVVGSDLYARLFPHVQLAADQATKVNFANTSTGSMMAAGVGGKATGERGDRVIIDDPHNVKDAESEAVRRTAVEWFREVIPSRVNDLEKDAFVVIQQRVHYDDVANAAIDMGYEHLNVPAHFDPDRRASTCIGWTDPRVTEGENFWPERFPEDALDDLKDALGPYAFAAQYEQSATPREGGLFKVAKLRIIPDIPEGEIDWAEGWDLAGTDEKENRDSAYTARVEVGHVKRTGRYVIAMSDRRRLSPGAVEDWIEQRAQEQAGSDTVMVLPQDPGQAGKAQRAALVKLMAGATFKFELQSGDKETRASPLAAQIENGNVDMVEGPWNADLIEEMRQFPRGRYKDQVDAASSAFNQLARQRRGVSGLHAVSSHVGNRAKVS